MMTLILNAAANTWTDSDKSKLLEAIEVASLKERRLAQTWVNHICEIFTEEEWTSWVEAKAASMDSTASEMISRVKLLGGKNLCEYTKKRLVAMWLYLRGDGRNLGISGRGAAAEHFKGKLQRALRDFEPEVYLGNLPTLYELKHTHPLVYNNAYTSTSPPHKLKDSELVEIVFLDNMMTCRGSLALRKAEFAAVVPHQALMQQQAIQMNPFLQQMQQMQQMRQMKQALAFFNAGGVQNAGGHVPGLQIFPPSNRTPRPMRGMSFGGDGSAGARAFAGGGGSHPPPLTDGSEDGEGGSHRATGDPRRDAKRNAEDEIEKVKRKMLGRGAKTAAAEKAMSDIVSDTEDGDSVDSTAKKTKRKHAKEKKSTCETPAVKKRPAAALTPKKLTSAGSDDWVRKPSVSYEHSREQVMCRTGKIGPKSTYRITYKDAGSKQLARKAAESWLAKQMKLYKQAPSMHASHCIANVGIEKS